MYGDVQGYLVMYRSVWCCIGVYGDVHAGVYGDVQGCMVMYRDVWLCMGVYGDV